MNRLKIVLGTLVTAGTVGAMDNQELAKLIQLNNAPNEHQVPHQVAPSQVLHDSPREAAPSRPVVPENRIVPFEPQERIENPSVPMPLIAQQHMQVQKPSFDWRTPVCLCANELLEMGKSLLYTGSENGCDLVLRYVQRHKLSEYAKTWMLIRLCCFCARGVVSSLVLSSYPEWLKPQAKNHLEYIRRIAVVEYLLTWKMYGQRPNEFVALGKVLSFAPPKPKKEEHNDILEQ